MYERGAIIEHGKMNNFKYKCIMRCVVTHIYLHVHVGLMVTNYQVWCVGWSVSTIVPHSSALLSSLVFPLISPPIDQYMGFDI